MRKQLIALLITAVTAFTASAQTNVPLFIKGNMDIKYTTRQNPPGTKNIQDTYDINLNIANSVLFHGRMTDRPQIIDGWISKTVTQPRSLKYDVSCDVMNPNNTAQVKKNVSQLRGFVNIASSGEYNYNGGLGFNVLDRYAGSDSKFSGVAAGKPLIRPTSWLDDLRKSCQTINITRSVNGKITTVALKTYDKMEFRSLVLAGGPISTLYPESTVSGEMLYDYDKNTWFINNIIVSYPATGKSGDRITGTIRWVEDEARKTNGKGQYEFDVRVNEPPVSESAIFASAPTDESAFFSANTSVPGLSGTMKYQDTLRQNPAPADPTTLASAVTIDLVGNSITKQQLMVLTKIIVFVSVIPMNAD